MALVTMALVAALLALLKSLLLGHHLALENLALRQQLATLKRTAGRPRFRASDRLFWVALAAVWPGWRDALHLVKPQTVLAWHRAGFRQLEKGGLVLPIEVSLPTATLIETSFSGSEAPPDPDVGGNHLPTSVRDPGTRNTQNHRRPTGRPSAKE